jgi:CRISPR-associated endonuclease Cas2
MVCYDITENRPRTRLADWLEREGFLRIQYSIFVGRMTAAQWRKFRRKLEVFHLAECEPEDRILSLALRQNDFENMLQNQLGSTILEDDADRNWILGKEDVWFPDS